MKVLAFADLHVREKDFEKEAQALWHIVQWKSPDVIAVAGDTLPPHMVNRLGEFCRLAFPPSIPVALCLGNHECWGRTFEDTLAELGRQTETNKNITYLDLGNTLLIDGIKFLGGMLFFDGSIPTDPPHPIDDWEGWQDYRITNACTEYRNINRYYVDSIKRNIDRDCVNVLITHHIPHMALNGHPAGSRYNVYSGMLDLLNTLEVNPKYYHYAICGHTHRRMHSSIGQWFGANVGNDYNQINYYELDVEKPEEYDVAIR